MPGILLCDVLHGGFPLGLLCFRSQSRRISGCFGCRLLFGRFAAGLFGDASFSGFILANGFGPWLVCLFASCFSPCLVFSGWRVERGELAGGGQTFLVTQSRVFDGAQKF